MSPLSLFLAEWRRRRDGRGHAGLVLALSAAGFAAALPWLGPAALALILPSSALALGWASGSDYKPGSRARKILLGAAIEPGGAALARALESASEALFTALLLAPPAILLLGLWQRGAAAGLLLGLSFVAAFLLASSVSFHASLLLGGTGRLYALYFLGAWLVPTAVFGTIRFLSPFDQAFRALVADPASPGLPLAAVALELASALALFALAAPAIASVRRRDAGA